MKKIITAIIALSLVATMLASCSSDNDKDDAKTTGETVTTTTTAADKATSEGDKTNEPATSGENLTDGLEALITKIYEAKPVELKLATMQVDLNDANAVKAYTGLDSADKLKEAYFSEPMMGSQAYSLVLMRLNDAADAEAVAAEVKAGINPAKWICVCADTPRVVAYGDVIMMVMSDPELADTVKADDIVDAFKTVCGGEFTVDLSK